MPPEPPSVPGSPAAEDLQACSECQSLSRLTNGLCLNCLLRGALTARSGEAGKDAFKEVLSGVRSRDGDWHIADHKILLDQHGEPLVSDFGMARCDAVSGDLTRSLSSFGTPGYIAPEQADGPAASLTAAADVYSLGAILFELLTGRTPFVGENAFAVMKQSAEERAPKVRTLTAHLDLE